MMLDVGAMRRVIAAGGSIISPDGRVLAALHEIEALQAAQPALASAPAPVPTEPTPPAWAVAIGQLSWQGENAHATLTCRTEPGPQSNGEVEAAIRRVADFMLQPARDEVAEAMEVGGHLGEYSRLLRALADGKRAGDAEVIARARTQVRAYRAIVMRQTEGKAAAVAEGLQKKFAGIASGEELGQGLARLLTRLLAAKEASEIVKSPNALTGHNLMELDRSYGFTPSDVA